MNKIRQSAQPLNDTCAFPQDSCHTLVRNSTFRVPFILSQDSKNTCTQELRFNKIGDFYPIISAILK